MGTVTNISSEVRSVTLLNGLWVEPGKTVEVHDDLLHEHDEACGDELIDTSTREFCDKHGFVWPESTWVTAKSDAAVAEDTARHEAYQARLAAQPPPEQPPEPPPEETPPTDETATAGTEE